MGWEINVIDTLNGLGNEGGTVLWILDPPYSSF